MRYLREGRGRTRLPGRVNDQTRETTLGGPSRRPPPTPTLTPNSHSSQHYRLILVRFLVTRLKIYIIIHMELLQGGFSFCFSLGECLSPLSGRGNRES